MNNSDINDIESAYYQAAKNKIEKENEDFSNPPHHLSPIKLPLKIKMQQTPKQLILIVHFTGKKRARCRRSLH